MTLHASIDEYLEKGALAQVHDRLIDADRIVREAYAWNCFPNWAMYRASLCGDAHYIRQMKHWAIAFTAAYVDAGGVKRGARNDELIGIVAMDAVYRLLYERWMQDCHASAKAAGVGVNTYTRLRRVVYSLMRASMMEYYGELLSAYWAAGKKNEAKSDRSQKAMV